MHDSSTNPDVFLAILGVNSETAAVHNQTACLNDIIATRSSPQPDSVLESWAKYYRPPLENEGFTSELDFETKHFAQPETLDNFIAANNDAVKLDFSVLRVVSTADYDSKQDACSTIEECSGWWRFTRIGYNSDSSEAVVHTDYDHPKWGLMGSGHFVLLANVNEQWSVVAKNMTWIS